MKVTHPQADRGVPPAAATLPTGETVSLDGDGVVEIDPDTARTLADAWAETYGVDAEALLEDESSADTAEGEPITPANVELIADEIIDEKLSEGECPWCDEYEGKNAGMHASRAHPEAWADYNED